MRSRFFDKATLLKEEGVKTKEFFSRRGSLDPLSEADTLLHHPEHPPSVRFLRALRFFHLNDPAALATALSADHLTSQEIDLLVSAACALISIGSVKDDDFDFILNSKGVSASRLSIVHEAAKDFDLLHSAREFSISEGVLDLCEGKLADIFAALTSFGFDRKIDRTLLVASAIEKFDATLDHYDRFPFPITTTGISFPEFLTKAYTPKVSRIVEYAKAGLIPMESDLLDLLESRFDPELIVSSKPSRIPSVHVPTYSPSGVVTPAHMTGYRGVDFDSMETPTRSSEYRFFVLLCTCLTMACGNAVPHPDVIRALGESFNPPKIDRKRDD